ncbi:MAG: GNAT family N-acetyltransferase [Bacteroidetes bacterium]|nr:MAG: GNAT family N-acetyltransferase [Bacteroidota bacterium]
MGSIHIKSADIATAVALSHHIPEFIDPPQACEYERRLKGHPHLILVAYADDKAVGFKVGYERDGSFYSWLGGVLPSYRRRSIALKLAEAQERWARQQGYKSVTFKTRNQHKNMLLFALKRNFDIIGFKEKGDVKTNRIILRKVL